MSGNSGDVAGRWRKILQPVKERREWLRRIPTKCEIHLHQVEKPQDVDFALADLLANHRGTVSVFKFWNALRSMGLQYGDPRLKECKNKFKAISTDPWDADLDEELNIDKETFLNCIGDNIFLIARAFKKDLVIPEFHSFSIQLENIYMKCKGNMAGQVTHSIPQLAAVDPDRWGVSVCTIDGQRSSFGDTSVPFALQACSMAVNYALALSDWGTEMVHNYVGFEPSGGAYDEIILNHERKPFNPYVNAGAITTVSLLKPDFRLADRFDWVFKQYQRLAGGGHVSYSNATFLSERSSRASDRNHAILHHLRENSCFPEGTAIKEVLEFYFQLNSIEVTAESGSVLAATLADGGICPITGERVLAAEAVRNTLSLMHSCGVNDHSGHFAFQVGLPAKSGVGGALLLVVPRVMGICCYSPRLDNQGNSVRAIQFGEELVKVFNFHNYDNFTSQCLQGLKIDPLKRRFEKEASSNSVLNCLFGAAKGDITTMRRFSLSGMNMEARDYDSRTALHLAAAEGHLHVVRMLIEKQQVNHEPKDRWNFTPLDDAVRFGHHEVARYLRTVALKRKSISWDALRAVPNSPPGGRRPRTRSLCSTPGPKTPQTATRETPAVTTISKQYEPNDKKEPQFV